jgi:5-methylcytosine-specific restriction endonuclease McrA
MPRRKTDPYRGCEWCGTALTRKRFSTGRLEDRSRFLARKFCDTACQQAAQNDPESVNRQTMYSRSRKHAKPNCERCGTTDRLHVHHRDGNITNNDPANLETLCVLCHNRHHFAGVSRTAITDLEASGTPSSRRSPNGSAGGSSKPKG